MLEAPVLSATIHAEGFLRGRALALRRLLLYMARSPSATTRRMRAATPATTTIKELPPPDPTASKGGNRGGGGSKGGGGATTMGTETEAWTTGAETAVALTPRADDTLDVVLVRDAAAFKTEANVPPLSPSPAISGIVSCAEMTTEPAASIVSLRRHEGSWHARAVRMIVVSSSFRSLLKSDRSSAIASSMLMIAAVTVAINWPELSGKKGGCGGSSGGGGEGRGGSGESEGGGGDGRGSEGGGGEGGQDGSNGGALQLASIGLGSKALLFHAHQLE